MRALSKSAFKQLQDAFLVYLVLLIRGQNLNDDERVGRFGEPAAAAPVHVKPHLQAA